MINFDLIQANIYVGSAPNSKEDVARLKQLKVSALISLQSDVDLKERDIDWAQIQRCYQENDITAQRYPVRDLDEIDLGDKIGQSIVALNRLLNDRHKVYVHCNAGIGRAPSTVLGYLCYYEGMSIGGALRQIRVARPIANPYKSAVSKALLTLADEASQKVER